MAESPDRGGAVADLRALARNFAAYAGRRGVFAGGLVAFGALLEGVSLALIVPLLGIVTASGTPFGWLEGAAGAVFARFGVATPFGKLALLMAVFGTVLAVRAVVLFLRDTTVADLQAGFIETQRLRIGERLSAASWEQLTRLRHARVTHVMSGDIQRVGMATHFLLQGGIAVAMLLAQCVLVYILAPALALWTFIVLAAGALVAVPLLRRAHGLGSAMTGANLTLLDSTAQFLGGLKLAISQNLQGSFLAEFRDTLRQLRSRHVSFARQQTTASLVLTTASAAAGGLLVLIGFGVFEIPPARLIVLVMVIARMSGPAGRLQQGAQLLAHALPAYRAVRDLEDDLTTIAPDEVRPAPAAAVADGPIVFEDVTFVHSGEDGRASGRGIRGVSLAIAPGEFIGIGGPSGAGKTTFADLLVGLIAPQQGRITVAGAPLQGAVLTAWRARLAYISQEPYLFHDTVRHNLAWAAPQAGEEAMWDALVLAGADVLVRRLEHGLDTVVGERGTLVSGGERQRLAIARAVLRRPRLLVMDEATSAIDIAGEKEILDRLRGLDTRPTIVLIAHRGESLTGCDRIMRFADGAAAGGEARLRPGRASA